MPPLIDQLGPAEDHRTVLGAQGALPESGPVIVLFGRPAAALGSGLALGVDGPNAPAPAWQAVSNAALGRCIVSNISL